MAYHAVVWCNSDRETMQFTAALSATELVDAKEEAVGLIEDGYWHDGGAAGWRFFPYHAVDRVDVVEG